MNSREIRQTFLDYFHARGHQVVPSSPLVPGNDPSLLFTNAGMVQFKDVFLGLENRAYSRAATAQRCVRAGGKHNDLENVGYTSRHHTFFEMLGNFSFGDYFKREAIQYAWDFLTDALGISPDRLWITVFHEDQEAEAVWLQEMGVDPERFSRHGEQDNFWAMADTGPCGPCSEIYYDHGAEVTGGPPGSGNEDGDRYSEIWNLVFMQYDRGADGAMTPLPKPSVDTGMGLERIAAVMQNVPSNYDTDLFQNLVQEAARLTDASDAGDSSLRVMADHIRSCAFLITDGVAPANAGRGYVLRRIIRRAVRHGYKLGVRKPFFHHLTAPLAEQMGDACPELAAAQKRVAAALKAEEEQFFRTLVNGMAMLEEAIAGLQGVVIPGRTVFRLYDTYGFPLDLTADIARERGLSLDLEGFNGEMARQKTRGRSASRFAAAEALDLSQAGNTDFIGYGALQGSAKVTGLFKAGGAAEELQAGEEGVVLLDVTPFYAEAGGQVGDCGCLETDAARFTVLDTQWQGEQILHHGKLERGCLRMGEAVRCQVDNALRRPTMLNHSATHLMHAALRKVLGDHVAQQGSLVHPDYLRFDFSHHQPVSAQQLQAIEKLVNEQISANREVQERTMSMEQAQQCGAMALFGEKYGDEVRVIAMGEESDGERQFSVELCGGTHVQRTGDIGLFKIIQESSIAAGIRRIEAVTGGTALRRVQETEQQVARIAALVKTGADSVAARVEQLAASNRALEKEVERLKAQLAGAAGGDLAARAEDFRGIKVLAEVIEGLDGKGLRDAVDRLKDRLGSAVIVLAAVEDRKVSLVAGVTRDLAERVQAGELVNAVAQQVGGKGGGRADMAMAGGNDPSGLEPALQSVRPYLETRLDSA